MASVGREAPKSTEALPTGHRAKRSVIRQRVWRDRWMYLLMVPGLLYFVVFQYVPMLGNIVAFLDYAPFLGVWNSPWVGLDNFRNLFQDPEVGVALRNTLLINTLLLGVGFPASITLALTLNSLLHEPIKRFLQSVFYLPHFLSWVIVISLWQQVFGNAGLFNQMFREQGWTTVNIMSNPDFFKFLVVLQYIWKEVGWESIIVLAALSKIDPSLYEAASLDGAGPWSRLWTVTLPGIRPVILLLLILWLGTFLTTGFEQFYLQRSAVGAEASEVLDTFSYFRGVRGGDWGLATAVGLVKGVFGAIMIFGANALAKRFGEEGIF